METKWLKTATLRFWTFVREAECHNARLDAGLAWIKTHSETHTAGCPLPLWVPRNRCCATSCLALRLQPPPPCLTRPLSPALHWWSLAGKNAMGPPSLPLPQSRVNTKIWQSQIETAFTPSIITLCNASLPHRCKQRLVWIPACLFVWIMSLCNGGAALCTYCLILSTDPFSLCAWEIPFQSRKSLF